MKQLVIGAILLVAAAAAWMFLNPMKGFGVCAYGLTTLDMVPIPVVDLQVRSDGSVHLLARKPKDMTLDHLKWLVDDKPETLIIAAGWKGGLRPRAEVKAFLQNYDVRILPTGEAVELYNQLIRDGRRVCIHVDATD